MRVHNSRLSHYSQPCDNGTRILFGRSAQVRPQMGLLNQVLVNNHPIREVVRDRPVNFLQRQHRVLKLDGFRGEPVLKCHHNGIQRNIRRADTKCPIDVSNIVFMNQGLRFLVERIFKNRTWLNPDYDFRTQRFYQTRVCDSRFD